MISMYWHIIFTINTSRFAFDVKSYKTYDQNQRNKWFLSSWCNRTLQVFLGGFFCAFFCFSYKSYAYEIITGLAALKLWTEPCNLQACPIQASSTTQSYTFTQITQFTKAKCISCHFHTLHHFVVDTWSLAVITVFSCIDSKFHELKKDNGWA